MAAPKRDSQTLSQPPQKRTKRSHDHHHLGHVVGANYNINLPDDILERIFSFLPVKKAVQVGVLSTRFRNTWVFNRNLFFDRDFSGSRSEFFEIIKRVFNSHVGSTIKGLRLSFDPSGAESVIERCIEISIEKGVEEIDLDFYQSWKPFKLSSQYIDVESIKILKLIFCEVDIPPNLQGLRFLHTLELRKVDLTTIAMETLFRHCLLLESLELWQCNKIRRLNVFGRNLKRFKVLKLGHCTDIMRIYVEAPTLHSIYYTGTVVSFEFAEVLQLDEVLLNFIPSKSFTQACAIETMVSGLSHVSVLTTTSVFLEGLTRRIRDATFRDMEFCFWNLKEFHLYMEGTTYCNVFDIAAFLKNCPCIEKLFIDLNEFSFEWGFYWELHQREILENFQHFFSNLKFIKVEGFKFEMRELQLVKFFLGKAVFLEALVLVTPSNGRTKFNTPDALIYDQFLCSWRASPKASIFICDHSSDDRTSLHPKHSKYWFLGQKGPRS